MARAGTDKQKYQFLYQRVLMKGRSWWGQVQAITADVITPEGGGVGLD